jgi:hypothetical protein
MMASRLAERTDFQMDLHLVKPMVRNWAVQNTVGIREECSKVGTPARRIWEPDLLERGSC